MKTTAILSSVTALAAALLACSLPNSAPAPDAGPAFQAGYRTIALEGGEKGEAALAADPGVRQGFVIARTVPGFDATRFARLGAAVLGSFDLDGGTYWHLRRDRGIAKLIQDLRRTGGVAWAEPELRRSLPRNERRPASRSSARDAAAEAAVFDDPATIANEYALEITGALDSYKAAANGYGDKQVTVAVIDSGIDMAHDDFMDGSNGTGASIVRYAKSAFSNNSNGTFTYVGDGLPLVSVPIGENWDDDGHGSHVAGIIAARGNNGIGTAGVAWKNTRIISYKCFSDNEYHSNGSGSDWAIYGSLKDLADFWAIAANRGAQTTIPVNLSLGGSYAGEFELEMINYALGKNVLPIVAMGNEGQRVVQYPAAYSGVIAVGATDGRDEKVSFSCTGNWISVSAPGDEIVSANNGETGWNVPNNALRKTGVAWMSGTSMATPFVTGLIGYLLSFDPTLTPDQIKAVLEGTAVDKGAVGFDEEYGWGRVDVLAAATAVRTHSTAVPAPGGVYVTKKITVSVVNTGANYSSGIGGFPSAVVAQPVFLYDAAGMLVSAGLSNATDGSVDFRLLRAGTYVIKANYLGGLAEKTITLGEASDQLLTLGFNVPLPFLIQTVPNLFFSNGMTWADSIITLYDSSGTNVIDGPYDQGRLDTLVTTKLVSGGTYLIKIEPFADSTGTYTGEYDLNIGFTAVASGNVNPGRPENQDDSDGNIDAAHAKPIVVGTDYAEYLSATGEWFSFVMP